MHFSLDFWNTIAQPNTEFSYQRTLLLSKKLKISFDEAKKTYTKTKEVLDELALTTGLGFSTKGVYETLTLYFVDSLNSKNAFDITNSLRGLESELQKMFLKFPPHINRETIDTLKMLKSKKHTFSITSNTNFISGVTIQKALYDKELEKLFMFYLFSDSINLAKPNPLLFEYVATSYTNYCEAKDITPQDIFHIGDHPVCDAPQCFKHRLIHNTSELSTVLKEISNETY